MTFIMRESSAGSTMMDSAPSLTSFKIERQPRPDEFHDSLSARINSRKSSAVRSPIKKRGQANLNHSRQTTATSRTKTEMTNMNFIHFAAEKEAGKVNSECLEADILNPKTNSIEEQFCEKAEEDSAVDVSNNDELVSTSSHIELNGEMKLMLENEYQLLEGGRSVKTPPRNMQIKDLIVPLDDWGSKDATIREKKFAVLPSIHSTPTSDRAEKELNTARTSISSTVSINNQLDFFRDKIEQEADFFADFRVNTSNVKVTPRQDILPPIKHGTNEKGRPSSPKSQRSRHSSRMKNRGKQSIL